MDDETDIGGPRRSFPDTRWTILPRGETLDPAARRRAWEQVLVLYWKPVYCAVRHGWNAAPEDAKDAVQDFFLDLLERDALRGLDPARGRFRAFLKAALRHFMMNARRNAGRLKRGGGAGVVPIDGLEPSAADEPESLELFERALERFRREEKEARVRVFELYELGRSERTYASVAAETGLSESDVRNHLHAARAALRSIVAELRG